MRKITSLLGCLLGVALISFAQAQTNSEFQTLQEYLEAGNTIQLNSTQQSPSQITLVQNNRGGGGTTSYADRASFQGDCGPLPLEDFAGGPGVIAGCGALISSAGDGCFLPGELIDGFTVGSVADQGGDDTVYVPSGAFGNPDDIVGSNTFTDATVVAFPGGDVTAVGMDLYSLLSGASLEVTVNGAGGVLDIYNVDVTSTGPVFFGVIATEPIVSIVLEDLSGGDAELISQLEFGECGSIECDSANYEATGLPLDIDGGDSQTADCAGDPNLVPVDVDQIGIVGTSAEIENVQITILHTWASDLDISLVSPAGTELLLSADNGGSGDNYILTVFEDGAPPIVGESAPFTGTYSPEGGTFADTFEGENVNGTWNLKVCDDALGDTGQIVAFEMNVCAQDFNDTCDDAFALGCGDVYAGSTAGATNTVGNAGPDVFFSFTGEGEQEAVTLSLCDGGTSFDSILWVFTDCTFSDLVATNDDSCGLQSEVTFVSDGSSTYYIVVDGFGGGSSGDFSLDVSCGPVTNDFCEGAETISCGETVTGSTDGATADNSELCGGEFNIGNGVWYTFTDDFGFPTDYVVSLCDGGTTYDSQLTVYEGDDCGNLTCVGGNDDFCGFQSEVSFTGDGSSTYYILVHGFGGATGSYSLNLDCAPIPPPNDDIENAIDVDEIGFPYTDPAVAMPAATTEDGNPVDCAIDGANGVWYKWTATEAGFAEGEIVSPAGFSTVIFFRAPDEDSEETDLIHIQNGNNQCLPSTTASILTTEGRTYYVFVVNQGGGTDINLNAGILGLEENGIEGFSFSPNPASDVLNINALDVIERATVYNILGQVVIDRTIDATSSQLNVSSLSVGTYIMKVTVGGQEGTYKIVKQ